MTLPTSAARIAGVAVVIVVGAALLGGVAAALPERLQGDDSTDVTGGDAQTGVDDPGSVVTGGDEDEPFDGRSTADTVRLVVGTLIAIASATAAMMLVFIWHTSPRRRLKVATRRAMRRRAGEAAEAAAAEANHGEVDSEGGDDAGADGEDIEGVDAGADGEDIDGADGGGADGDGAGRSGGAEVGRHRG